MERNGIDIISPRVRCLDDITLTTQRKEGQLLDVTLSLSDQVHLRNFMKVFPARDDLVRAVEAQQSVHNTVRETEYATMVPEPRYVNIRRRILTMPFIAGTSLRDALAQEPAEGKETLLRRVIDRYVALFSHLQGRRDELKLTPSLEDFNDFFEERYIGDDKNQQRLLALYREHIGNALNQERQRVAHGDLHPKNIIINGDVCLLTGAQPQKQVSGSSI